MLKRILPVLFIVSLSLLTIVGVYTTRKPLCIDSKVVDRIDRVEKREGIDSLYRCAYKKETPFSVFLLENHGELSRRIRSVERVLENVEPFKKRFQITISKDRPFMFNVKGQALFIGEELLHAPGHLEKGIAKIWLNEKRKHYFSQQNLLEEAITDFIVFLAQGDLDLGDPETKIVTRLQPVKWPYIMKSVSSYCETPWKKSEHYSLCRRSSNPDPLMDELVVEASLRPMLSYAWIEAYKRISLTDRHYFLKSLVRALNDEPLEKLPIIPQNMIDGNYTSLAKASTAIKNINLFLIKSRQIEESEPYQKFVNEYIYQLKTSGYEADRFDATFDLLFISKVDLQYESSVMKGFVDLSKKNIGMQIAVQDRKKIWMLPSKNSIDVHSFGEVKAHKGIMEVCGNYNINDLLSMHNRTEKLLLVENCNADVIDYSNLFDQGIEAFAMDNPNKKFIQLHLPSLDMKKEVLKTAGDIWDFIRKRDHEQEAFASLGWSEVNWVDGAKAYRPKAAVEAIEWFRVE